MKILNICLASLFLSTLAFAENYKIIVDAGSTGSRLHLYEYHFEKNIPSIKEVYTTSIEPGLSSFEQNPQAAGPSLKKLFDDAVQQLTHKKIDPHEVEVNVLATAGMRLLPEKKQAAIYANIKDFLKHGYTFFPIGHIETISGKDEAFYGWLDVNYLAGSFQPGKVTSGSIDIGGASTQIAFETDDTSKPDDEINFSLDGHPYRIFAKSFLGLGLEEARITMNDHTEAANCYPINYSFAPSKTGHFSFANCLPIFKIMIQNHHVAEALLPIKNHQHFFAFSGAWHAYHFLGTEKTPDQAIVEPRIQTVCANSWEQLKDAYRDIPEKYLGRYCAYSVYVDNLLHNTYQLQSHQLTITSQINNQGLDWAVGAMLFFVSSSK